MNFNNILTTHQFEGMLEKNKSISELLINKYISDNNTISCIIIKKFDLDLVYEIFILGISDSTYNGFKRKKLRKQEIFFIEVFNIYYDFKELTSSGNISLNDLYFLLDILDK